MILPKHIIYLMIIIGLLCLLYLFINKKIEHYLFPYEYRPYNYPIIQPWNMLSPSTRNMSYDLRGDPFPIPYTYTGPWLNSTIY